jgi:hypothetical protein
MTTIAVCLLAAIALLFVVSLATVGAAWSAIERLNTLNDLITDRLAAVAVRESLEIRRGGPSADEAAVTAMALTIAAESLAGAHTAMASAVNKLDELKKIHQSRLKP